MGVPSQPNNYVEMLKFRPPWTEKGLILFKCFLTSLMCSNTCIKLWVLPIRQRTLNIKYKLIHAKLKVYENSFCPYTIKLWNSLSNKITNITDRDAFKMALTKISYIPLFMLNTHFFFLFFDFPHPITLTRLSEVTDLM